jgi:hypothetical protein
MRLATQEITFFSNYTDVTEMVVSLLHFLFIVPFGLQWTLAPCATCHGSE